MRRPSLSSLPWPAVFVLGLAACGGGQSPGGGPGAPPAPVITQQPSSLSVVAGQTASFQVVASNATGYRWQRSSPGGATFDDVAGATLANYTTPPTALADSGTRYRVVASGAADSVTSDAVTLTVTAVAGLPADPATTAPPVDPTVAPDLLSTTAFLYTGPNPLQTGVAAGTIEARRVAVLRGTVQNREGGPLPGVQVSVLGHPELGRTLSRADGGFDLAVNGGGPLTLRYEGEGLLPVQRAVVAPWRDYAWAPDVVMVPLDPAVTTIRLGAGPQVVRGSVVTDRDGVRQATVFVPAGTTASMVLPDGSTAPLTTANVRATEFTVGPSGPRAMPATLPPASGYTYAAELSVDEALAAGATDVRFDAALPVYVENFLGFPVGSIVPSGYYDRQAGKWMASANGRVVQVLASVSGLAGLDADGDGAADDGARLTALGVTDAERGQLAQLYAAGQTLWRVPVTHFTPWDFNWPFGPPPGASPPAMRRPARPRPTRPARQCGSIIGCETQSLGEDIPLTGTPFGLHYQSERTPGNREALVVPLTGATLPPSLKRVELEVTLAGKRMTSSQAAAPNLTQTIPWDGRDGYGRALNATQGAKVRIGYVYPGVYMLPGQRVAAEETADVFGHFTYLGAPASGDRERLEITLWQEYEATIERMDASSFGLGGWSLDVLHAYSPSARALLLGTGEERRAEALSSIITTVAGTGANGFSGDGGPATAAALGWVKDVAVGPDGSLYIADATNYRVRRVGPDGVITTVAGNGVDLFLGDGGPATLAGLSYPDQVAVGPDGSLFIGDSRANRIRRVGPDGFISAFAGTGATSFAGNGLPATATGLARVFDLAFGPDGSLYLANGFEDQIHRIGPDGIVSTIAGLWDQMGYSGDGGLASAARVGRPQGVAVGRDGTVYIADSVNSRVRRVSPDGIIDTFAGSATYGTSGDGGPATLATLSRPSAVAAGRDGVYIADEDDLRIRHVGTDGIITTVAGTGASTFRVQGDGGPATAAPLGTTGGMAVGPDGSLYLADSDHYVVRRLVPLLPSYSDVGVALASEDGREIYVFNQSHRHLRTLDGLTGAVRYEFGYSAAGYLTSVTDGSGNVTTIERQGQVASAIVGPGGHRTELAIDSNGWLRSVTNPLGEAHTMTSSFDGLLETFTDPRGKVHQFSYDTAGRLVFDHDPAGGSTQLTRLEEGNDYTITTTSALGRARTYRVQQLSTGAVRRTVTSASGASTTTLLGTDGTEQTTYPDGKTVTVTLGPDPRWGMLAPVAKSVVARTPGGRTRTITGTRTATLSNPDDLLSLVGLTDTVTDNGRVSTLVYADDGTSRTLTYTTPAGRGASLGLDALGRVVAWGLSGLDPTGYSYDGRGSLTRISEGGVRDTSLTYDAAFQRTGFTDPLGRAVGLSYDGAARVVSLTLPGARVVSFGYDAAGNPTAITPPGRAAHTAGYTDIGLASSYTPPGLAAGGGPTLLDHDLDRALAGVTLPGGPRIDVTYDAAGRPSAVGFTRGSLGYGYDAADRLTGITAPGGLELSYGYDGDLLTSVRWTGPISATVAYTYDDTLQVTAETIDGGSRVAFGYDLDGLLTTAGSLTVVYDPLTGLRTGSALGSVVDQVVYDGFGEAREYHATFAGAALYDAVYTRDASGRITGIVETVEGVPATYRYDQDAAGRLVGVTRNGTSIAAHVYDANGNRTASNGVSATYDAQDRLTARGGTSYSYGGHGTLSSKTTGAQVTAYLYDELGALQEVGLPDGRVVGYLVDGEGRRIGRRVNGVLVQGLLYQGALRPIAELDGAGAVVSRFVYGTHLNVPDYLIRGGVPYRILTDHLGSPRLVVDATTGVVAQRLDYDELGRVVGDSNPGFQPFGFAGGLHDPDTGLIRFGMRDYDPEAGRWTARDPLGFAGRDTNLYAYAHGDPVNFVDPDGRAPVCRVIYVRSRDTRLLQLPVASASSSMPLNGVLQPGAIVNFLRTDPTGQWSLIETVLPNGAQAQGWTLNQNLSTSLPPPTYDGAGRPMSPQAFPSWGAGTKG